MKWQKQKKVLKDFKNCWSSAKMLNWKNMILTLFHRFDNWVNHVTKGTVISAHLKGWYFHYHLVMLTSQQCISLVVNFPLVDVNIHSNTQSEKIRPVFQSSKKSPLKIWRKSILRFIRVHHYKISMISEKARNVMWEITSP